MHDVHSAKDHYYSYNHAQGGSGKPRNSLWVHHGPAQCTCRPPRQTAQCPTHKHADRLLARALLLRCMDNQHMACGELREGEHSSQKRGIPCPSGRATRFGSWSRHARTQQTLTAPTGPGPLPVLLLCGGRERGRLSQRTNVLRVAGLLQADLYVDMPVLMYVVAQEEDGVPRAVTPVESAPSKVLLLLT